MEYISLSDAQKIFPDMDPEVLKNHIAIATAAIDALIGGSLELTDLVARIDGNDSKFLYLAEKPESVQKITDGRHTYAVDFIDGHMIALDHAAPKGLKNIVVHYRAGFAQVPEDFRQSVEIFTRGCLRDIREELAGFLDFFFHRKIFLKNKTLLLYSVFTKSIGRLLPIFPRIGKFEQFFFLFFRNFRFSGFYKRKFAFCALDRRRAPFEERDSVNNNIVDISHNEKIKNKIMDCMWRTLPLIRR